jgi:GT2 family glycosyltransferase
VNSAAPRVAALLTSFNRRETTLACLSALFSQVPPDAARISAFLLDDASPDGTAAAVATRFPSVRLLLGTGSLYWNGGMRRVFAAALAEDFEYYLWLNDDTILAPDAVAKLLATERQVGAGDTRHAIVVGSARDPNTGAFTYGGVARASRWHPLRFRYVMPGSDPIRCDTMNGNCVLIPRAVARSTGNLDPAFTHNLGDLDYGLRAGLLGFSLWVAPGFIGVCRRPAERRPWFDPELPLARRWAMASQPKGLPIAQWRVFAQRHGSALWPLFFLSPYVRMVLQRVLPSPPE